MATCAESDGIPATSNPQLGTRQTIASAAMAWLCRSWAIAGIFHFLSFHDWRWQGGSGFALIALGLFVCLRPTLASFALFVLVDIFAVSSHMGPVPNHILFSLLMNIVMLATIAWSTVAAWRDKHLDLHSEWLRTAGPIIRVSVFVLYFFTVFHKLNRAYFNPDVSCAVTMLDQIGAMYPFLPTGRALDVPAIYGTLIIEAIIPILMFIPRTRIVGAALAIGFHALLSLHPHPGIYSFTATIFSLLSWFVPPSFIATLQLSSNVRNASMALWGIALIGILYCLYTGMWIHSPERLSIISKVAFDVGYYGILVYALSLLIVVVMHWRSSQNVILLEIPGQRWTVGQSILVAPICLLLMLIGMQPYLGLRTRMCFSMFSNLQTEGVVGNHLVMSDKLQLTTWQKDLVTVVSSDDPGLASIAERHHQIPLLELSRRVRESRAGFHTTYVHQNVRHTCLSGDGESLSVLPKLSKWDLRYLYFRSVTPEPSTVPCQW